MADAKTTTTCQPEPGGECLFRLSALSAELQLDIFRRAMLADVTVVSLTNDTMYITGEVLRADFKNIALTCRLAAAALKDIKRRNRRALLKQQGMPEDAEGSGGGGGQDPPPAVLAAAATPDEHHQPLMGHAQLERVLGRADRETVLCMSLDARYRARLLAAPWARHVRHVVVESDDWAPAGLWSTSITDELRLLVRALAGCCDGLKTVVILDSSTLHTGRDAVSSHAASALAVARYALGTPPPLRRHSCLSRLDLFFTMRGKKAPVYKLLTVNRSCAWCSPADRRGVVVSVTSRPAGEEGFL